MVTFRCFSVLIGRKNKIKGNEQSLDEGLKTLRVQIDHPGKSSENDELKPATLDVSLPCSIQKDSRCNVRVISLESPAKAEVDEAYEGEDEHEDVISMKRDNSDFDLQAHVAFAAEDGDNEITFPNLCENQANKHLEDKSNKDSEKCVQMIQSGHVSDPGIGRAVFWASPKLMRSCSNLERRDVLRKTTHQLYSSMSQSYEDLQELSANHMVTLESPRSVMTHRSADRVMLKRHSSIQLLPSRSRRLWWKLFLWSHRNVHRPWTSKLTQLFPSSAALKRQGGYTSDTLEPKQGKVSGNLESPGSFTGESLNIISIEENIDNQSWRGFSTGHSGLWPQNQWVAFSAESSSFARVDEWVKELEAQEPLPVDDNDNNAESIVFPPSPHASGSAARHPAQLVRHADVNLSKEILNANAIVQSLNPTSTAAHISAIGLKNIPAISHFCSLRSVNLSNNFIVHITPGLLPKGLHTLDLSRNKISTIEGFRELTRLRVLNLSYNRISRIGQGLSNCTLIKELYLAGNKISDVEGLHRLLKLTVLDLSFNKITTAKALGQLVANYNSLQALNLLGNPIQRNISDDHLRKTVCGLLPKLVYLNKQPIKPQRAREVLTDSVAKAALGNSSRSSYRKPLKKASQGGSVSSSHRGSASVAQRSRNRPKSRNQHRPMSIKGTPQ